MGPDVLVGRERELAIMRRCLTDACDAGGARAAQLAVTADPFAAEIEPDLGERALRAAEATGDPDAFFLALHARRTELTDIRCSLQRLTLGERAIADPELARPCA